METDKVKRYKSLILFSGLFLFSLVGFAQNEICNDGKDNNGDGKIDCLDSYCNYAAQPTVEKGCNCFDGKDNDGDGKIDAADSDCATYYGLTFTGTGSTCSITPPNSNTPFASMAPPQQSNQNTADTPSKISVGDMNGDGVPDAVVTSKWNSTIQVVATATASGFSPGDIMSDYRTPGKNIFPTKGADWVFEHETGIADINGDKKGELYAIASRRPGGPNNPPLQYALCGFTYANNTLVPLFDAVDLGTVRPGSFGIADFDGDGKGEIYLRNQIYAAESGVKLADAGGNWATAINSGPVAVNMLGDNKLELVCGNFIYGVPSLASRTLQTLTVLKDLNTLGLGPTYYPKGFNDVNQYGINHVSTTSTADVDGDGFMDVVLTGAINCSGNEAVPCANNVTTIFYWNVQKNTLSTYAPADPVYPVNGWIWGTGRVNLDDATGDGKLDLVFVAGAQIFCLTPDASGTLVKTWVRTINDNPGVLSLTIYDFNNDGNPEVVYRDAQQLSICDGKTGQTTLWSSTCQAYTFTEGPIVADVNGDGGTDICITCYTSNAFNLAHDTPQQESLGQTRLYYSNTNSWLPTRRVWNEHPYYVTNINDNLTLPFPQLDPSLNFGNAPCPNGIPGPHRPFNVFMDQVPTLSADGCPIYPAPDLTFFGDDPAQPGVDTNGDGKFNPTVVIVPPICGNTNITGQFNIVNNGSLPITDNVPFAFFDGDPTTNPTTATRLYTNSFTITNLQVGGTYTSPVYPFTGSGKAFTLYIVIYNNGATLPIVLTGQSTKECSISNNIYSVAITPTPFSVTVAKVSDNNNCPPYNPPNTGQLAAHVFVGGVEVPSLAPYSFQWYTGTGTASPIAGATSYNLPNLDAGTYSVVVTNTQKGCSNPYVTGTIARVNGGFPTFTITKISDQTICVPPNGEVVVAPDDGSSGYTYSWLDTNLNPIGVTSADAKNLVTGNYIVNISRGTCNFPGTRPQIFVPGPVVADAQAKTLQNVVDCSNPNTGSIQADAYIGVTVQNPANYTFDWYFYNNATSTRGSILPPVYGTGQIRTGLPVGYYQAVITDKTTKCVSSQTPIAQVQSQTVIPDPPVIRQLAPQTSCDPAKPNGSMIADVYVGGVLQNPAGFTFQWFKGQNTLPANLVATVSGVNGQEVDKVAGGGIPYTVKVTTAFNCTSNANAPVTETINLPILTLAQLTPNTVCDVAKTNPANPYNGSVKATVTFGGVGVTLPDPNYTFAWYDGTTTTTPHSPATSSGPNLTGLKDGNYAATVTRTDLFCTSAPQTTPVVKTTVAPILSPTSTGSNNCDPALTPDGTVTVAVTNTVAGDVFTYKWYKGSVVGVSPLTTGVNSQNGDQATAIKVGGPIPIPNPYTVYVLNTTTGCDNNVTQFVGDNSVIPVLTTTTAPNSICAPTTSFNGSMTVSLSNPVGTYVYPTDFIFTWYDANTNNPAKIIGSPSTTTNLAAKTITLTTLKENPYTVEAKNTLTGCKSAPYTDVVGNAKIFPALLPASTGSNNCINNPPTIVADGTASYTVTNLAQAAGPFTQQWYTGAVDPNTTPGAKISTGTNASADKVTLLGVGGPNIPAGSAPHTYTVLVTNTLTGCTNFTPASVPDNSVVPVIGTTTTPNSVCDLTLGFKGTMTATWTNPAGSYNFPADFTFAWSKNGTPIGSPVTTTTATTITLTKLDVDSYTVVGTNTKTGCVSAAAGNAVGNNKVFPVLTPSATGSNNCIADATHLSDGTASATASGTPGGYNYKWYNGTITPTPASAPIISAVQPTLTGLGGPAGAAGTPYTVWVIDQGTGCDAFANITVPDNSTKPILSTSTLPNDICDVAKGFAGSMIVSLSNGPLPGSYPAGYTFSWYDGATTAVPHPSPITTTTATTISLTKLDAGQYSVKGTNNTTGCISVLATDAVADQKIKPAIQPASTGSHNCTTAVASDGTATATITNIVGADTFNFVWTSVAPTVAIGAANNNITNNATTATAIKLGGPINAPNSYKVTVTNNRSGCVNDNTIQVSDLSQKPTLTMTATDNTICSNSLGIAFNGRVDVTGVTHPLLPSQIQFNWSTVDLITSALTFDHSDGPLASGTVTDSWTPLNAGKYAATVKVVNADCTSDPMIVEVKNLPAIPVVTTTVVNNTNCVGFNGKVDVTSITESGAGAALGGFNYQWFDGGIVAGAPRAETTVNGPSGIQANTYTVQVTSKTTGCQGNTPSNIVDAKVTPVISVSFVSDNTNCTGTPNGVLQQSVVPAGPAYTISWFPQAPTVYAGGVVSGNQYTQLLAGSYSANATDPITGCKSLDDTKSVGDNLVYPVIGITPTDQTSCNPATPNGALAATADGTTNAGIYNFVWHDGIGLAGLPHAQTSTGLIDQLPVGNYTIQITKISTGCASTQSPSVANNLTYPVLTLTPTGVANCTTPDGKIAFSQTGLLNPNLYRLWFLQESGNTTTTNASVIKTTGTLIQQTASPIPDKTLLAPHYYTALLRDSATHCQSQPVSALVAEPSFPSIAINAVAAGSTCGAAPDVGSITTVVTGGTGAYTFKWYKAAPSNTGITFIPDPPTPANPPNMGAAPVIQTTQNLTAVGTGTYTLVVTDAAGCGDYNVQSVPALSAPTISVTQADNTKCQVGQENGSLAVVVTGVALVTYQVSLYTGNDPVAAQLAGPVPVTGGPFSGVATVSHTFINLKQGDYLIKVDDSASPTCPTWHNYVIDQVAFNPVVVADIVNPNTSCNPAASADGSIKVTVSSVPNPPNTNAASASFEITSITPAPTIVFATPHALGLGGNVTINGFKPTSYSILVTDNFSGCTTTAVVNMSDQPNTPDVISATISPETDCANSSKGKALAAVAGVTNPNLTQFDFTWAQNIDLTGAVYAQPGDGAGTLGELLNQAHATAGTPGNFWPMGTPGTGSGDRTFYLQGARNVAPGFGCKTTIIQVVVPDTHVSPDMTLTPAFDSFCLATAVNGQIGDGTITIAADSDPTTGGQQNAAGGFDYSWTSPNAGLASPQLAQSNNFVIPKLGDGTYTVTATNATNNCTVVKSAVIAPAPVTVAINSATITDQRICNKDGQIDLTQITVDRSAIPAANIVETNATPLTTNYTFEWYPADVGNPGSFTPANQLKDNTNTFITVPQSLVTGAGAQQFANMAAGTYYVKAIRKAGSGFAEGCPTLPFRVDLNDKHVNPLPSLTILSNTSCNPGAPGEGEIKINPIADATNVFFKPAGGFTFGYAWSGGNALSLPVNGPGNGNGVNGDFAGDVDDFTNLIDSATPYSIAVTNNQSGCTTVTTATILKNALPVFVQTVSVLDQIMCAADGSLTVGKVSLNDATGLSQDFVTGPVGPQGNINNFNFDWKRAGVGPQTTAGNVLNAGNYNTVQLGGTGIGAGSYTVVAIRTTGAPGNGCKSAPFPVDIKDLRVNPVVTLTPFSNTACNATFEGEITVKTTDATTFTPIPVGGFTFDYNWTTFVTMPYAGHTSVVANGNDGDGFGGGEQELPAVTIDNDGDHPTTLQDGAYTVRVTNPLTLCFTDQSTTILKNATPVFVQGVTIIDPILCMPDGSITVDKVSLSFRAGSSPGNQDFVAGGVAPQGDLLADFQFDWTRVGTAGALTSNGAAAPAGAVLDKTTYVQGTFPALPTFGAGSYTVVATRKNGSPGAGCPSAPFTVVLQDKSIAPAVSLTPLANTSCDPLFFEGEIKTKVTDATANNAAHTFTPFTYDYTWTAVAPAVAPASPSLNNDGDGFGGGEQELPAITIDNDGDHPTGLSDGSFSITVTNPQTGCVATGTTSIFKNGTPVFTQLVTATDQVLCSADGKLLVQEVKIIDRNGVTQSNLSAPPDFPLTDFNFQYDRVINGTTTTVLGFQVNNQLDNSNYVTPGSQPAPPGIGFGTYYVTTKRVSGFPGKDCSSAPYKIDILDKRVFPAPSLTPLANTSCDPLFFEGEIKVKVTDASVNIPPPLTGTPFTYSYNWTVAPTAIAGSGGNDGDGFGGGEPETPAVTIDNDGDHPKLLSDGSYSVTVTNDVTGCSSVGSTTIFKNGTPVFTQLVVSAPQVLCNPDGKLTVQEVKIIDRNGVIQSNLNSPPDFALTDFEFTYDRVIGGVTTNVLTDSPDAFLDNTNYTIAIPPGVGFGTYYVTTTRKLGFPGKNCSSAPYKVDIDDQRLLPKISFTSIANSACNIAKPNGSITAAASEQNGTNTDPYTFTWTLNGQPIGSIVPTPPVQTDASPNSVITSALDGAYITTVTNTNTGCPFDASFNLLLDQTRSTPNVIDVTTVDPLDCNPSASETVTKITLGSTFNSTTQPPNIAPDNTVTGAALAGFTYIWAAGNPGNVIAGQTAPTILGLKPGAYFVSVIDPATDCQSGPKEADISDINIIYPVASIAQTAKQISCIASIGTAALQATAIEQDGTTGSYNFTWYPSLDNTGVAFAPPSAPSVTNNPNDLINLVVGNYSITVHNTVSSCDATALFIVPDDAPTFLPVISGVGDPLTLCVGLDGDAEVRVIPDPNYPNPPSYNYKADLYLGATPNLSNPPDFANVPSIPGPIPGIDLVFEETNLNLGFYTFLVTDNNTGCTTTATVEVKDGRVKPVIDIVQDNPLTNCDPAIADGQLAATADGGKIQGYTFDWYAGTTVPSPGTPLQSDNKLIGLGAGSYTVRVTSNLTQCFNDKTGSVQDSTLLPPIPTAIVVADRTSCVTPDGDVSATVGGVILNYLFSWYDGSATKPAPDYQSPDYPNRDVGPFTVTAMDQTTGCISKPATVTVLDKRVNPDFDLSSTASYCVDTGRPKGNGSVTLTLNSQGMVLSDIQWFDHNTNAPVGLGPQVFELFPGIYDVKAVSTYGCEADGSVELGTEISPYNGISSNGDGQNDSFIIDCITNFPNNNVKIFNRNGIKVYEVDGYNNGLISFRGIGEEGLYLANRELPVGTYFYIVDKRDGSKPKTGFLELTR